MSNVASHRSPRLFGGLASRGLLNNVALSTMFVCSVSTVVFNGNPLLRYDGYYILSDLMKYPICAKKPTSILNRQLGEWCLGLGTAGRSILPTRNQFWFMLYSVAASVYSWVVMFSILFFLFRVFQPYRLEVIGQIIGIASIASLVGRPALERGQILLRTGKDSRSEKTSLYASLASWLRCLAAVAFVPLPYHVFCTFLVEPRNADPVYVKVAGQARCHSRRARR